jgi:hypothetical protein
VQTTLDYEGDDWSAVYSVGGGDRKTAYLWSLKVGGIACPRELLSNRVRGDKIVVSLERNHPQVYDGCPWIAIKVETDNQQQSVKVSASFS